MKKEIILLSALMLFAAGSAAASPQDTLAQLNQIKESLRAEISGIEQKVRNTDSLARNEAQRFTEQKQRLETDLVAREQENETLGKRLNELQDEIRSLSAQIEGLLMQQRGIDANMSFLGKRLAHHCTELQNIIQQSLPWNRGMRRARVVALRNDLLSEAADPLEGFARLNALIAEEISFGDDIVLEQQSVQRNNGTLINARMLRIGNLFMVYVDQAEEFYGVLSRSSDTTFIWREDLSFSEREQIRNTIRVKEGKRAPGIVTLPLTLSVEQQEEQNEE